MARKATQGTQQAQGTQAQATPQATTPAPAAAAPQQGTPTTPAPLPGTPAAIAAAVQQAQQQAAAAQQAAIAAAMAQASQQAAQAQTHVLVTSTISSPVAVVRMVYLAMLGAKRSTVINACVLAGVAPNTAKTQYQVCKAKHAAGTLPGLDQALAAQAQA